MTRFPAMTYIIILEQIQDRIPSLCEEFTVLLALREACDENIIQGNS